MQKEVSGGHRLRELLREPTVDPQVYMGTNLLGAHSDIELYKTHMREMNVVAACIIPETTHELRLRNGFTEHSCMWRIDGQNRLIYEKFLFRGGKRVSTATNPKKPYFYSNKYTLEYLRNNKTMADGRRFFFVPIVHPKLDRPQDLEHFLNDENAVAVKLHGLATHTIPAEVPGWVPRLASRYDKPFIIHTDYYSGDVGRAASPELARLMQGNNPSGWADWVIGNNVRAFLAHGIRLDAGTEKKIRREEGIVVGTGPDYVINVERERRFMPQKEYLSALFDLVEPEKIIFATDFAWNWTGRQRTEKLQWDSKRKVIEAAMNRGLNRKEIIGILMRNAARFFEI